MPQERMSASTSGYIQMDLQKGKDKNQFKQIDWKKGEVQNQYIQMDLQRSKYIEKVYFAGWFPKHRMGQGRT